MSGGDVGGDGGGSKRKNKFSKRKPKKRLNIRIDMTPLVDVAFLLLTFFMMTTVFRLPQTLEINLPPKDVDIKVGESNLLTIRVDENMQLYWNVGFEVPHKITWEEMNKFLKNKRAENPRFNVLIKIDKKAKYHMMIDIIDELRVTQLDRYALAPMTDIDKREIARAI
ncbi:MAG: biopolymer transporter ExbD [Ignavibacteriales bacterium]|nr:biopolymer transporter ExbD [Ignavibacteriales bacterium]